jgi:hypothetical protein
MITTRASGISAPRSHEALHALVAVGETVVGNQVLPDRHAIVTSAESQFDGFSIGCAGAGASTGQLR